MTRVWWIIRNIDQLLQLPFMEHSSSLNFLIMMWMTVNCDHIFSSDVESVELHHHKQIMNQLPTQCTYGLTAGMKSVEQPSSQPFCDAGSDVELDEQCCWQNTMWVGFIYILLKQGCWCELLKRWLHPLPRGFFVDVWGEWSTDLHSREYIFF